MTQGECLLDVVEREEVVDAYGADRSAGIFTVEPTTMPGVELRTCPVCPLLRKSIVGVGPRGAVSVGRRRARRSDVAARWPGRAGWSTWCARSRRGGCRETRARPSTTLKPRASPLSTIGLGQAAGLAGRRRCRCRAGRRAGPGRPGSRCRPRARPSARGGRARPCCDLAQEEPADRDDDDAWTAAPCSPRRAPGSNGARRSGPDGAPQGRCVGPGQPLVISHSTGSSHCWPVLPAL